MKEDKIITAEKIKELCKLMHVSNAELASRLNMTPQNFYNKLRRGNFTVAQLDGIAKALGAQFVWNFSAPELEKAETVFRMGELFCGPGGLANGYQRANVPGVRIEHAWANDFDQDTCNTYIRNICPDKPESVICHDVRTLDIEKLGTIDALAFGFPCNDFSNVGEKKGLHGEFGPLYTYGVKALNTYHPKWFLAENVGGLAAANEGSTFKKILDDLRACGYRLYPNLYKFEEYGIPQMRHRIIIIGIREDLPYEYKVPSTEPYINADVTCKTAIECPPIPKDAPNNERTMQSEKVVERLKHIKPGQNAFNANLPPDLQLNVKGAKISQIYKRLDPSRPAYTVTGSGGGGTHIYHWEEPRALTNRERARLQTFPDDYIFEGSKEKVRKQIGMAVPCRGAKIIFEAILKTFAGIEYPSIPCNILPKGDPVR
nr:DNA (cytosine-5-)-methyltransferase [uncultured Sphaerochaeta sp.]